MALERAQLTGDLQTSGVPAKEALADAVKILMDVTRNEETRFSNLNTRAVAVISATSIVTAVAGFFSKDIFGKDFTGWGRTVGALGIIATVVLLAVTAGLIVWGVLAPGPRFVFGQNPLVDAPSSIATAEAVNTIAFTEYLTIYGALVHRNKRKAESLTDAYWTFLGAVAVIAATAVLVVISRV